MKKLSLAALGCLILASCANEKGKVTIQLPEDFPDSVLIVNHQTIEDAMNQSGQDMRPVRYDTLRVKNNMAELKLDPSGAARYNIQSPVMAFKEPDFYASPDDNLEVVIKSFSPLDYSVSGSELMEDITALSARTVPIQAEYISLIQNSDSVSPEQANEILSRYDEAIKKFVAENPKSHAVPYAILELSATDFKAIYDNMTPEARKSILMPYADSYNREVADMLKQDAEMQARKAEVNSGTITAPDFTLPDLKGKMVSLSDFRGRWVVLDFWGSWCGWCVKGFPALKDAYKQYGDKIVIIGIDCNESEDDWRAGVEKHQIPWIQLYNGNDKAIYEAYNIEGFPTKAIINPEGKLVNLTTGEDPAFFDQLAKYVK